MKRLLVVSLLLAACVTAPPSRTGDEAAIVQTLHDACKAYLDGDVSRIEYLLTDDFTLTDADGVVTTRADDIQHAKNGTLKYTIFENSEMKVRLHGDAAVVTGITKVAGMAGTTSFAATFQFTDTMVREGGRWRVAASHISRV